MAVLRDQPVAVQVQTALGFVHLTGPSVKSERGQARGIGVCPPGWLHLAPWSDGTLMAVLNPTAIMTTLGLGVAA